MRKADHNFTPSPSAGRAPCTVLDVRATCTAIIGTLKLNHMVQCFATIDIAFAALADATRRGVIEQLGRGDARLVWDITLEALRLID
jgi:hypothetical protein